MDSLKKGTFPQNRKMTSTSNSFNAPPKMSRNPRENTNVTGIKG